MRKVYIFIGAPCSGKSTLIERMRKDGDMVFSTNDILEQIVKTYTLDSYTDLLECTMNPEMNYFKSLYEQLCNLMFSAAVVYYEGNIFVDCINMTKYQRKIWFEDLSDENTEFIAVDFNDSVSLDELLERNAISSEMSKIGKKLPNDLIEEIHKLYEEPTKEEGFFTIIKP